MIKKGKLVKWNRQKGFGFIQIDNENRQIFVHISAFPKNSGRPVLNESLSFQTGKGKQGKPAAVAIRLIDREMPDQEKSGSNHKQTKTIVMLVILVLLVACGIFSYKYMI